MHKLLTALGVFLTAAGMAAAQPALAPMLPPAATQPPADVSGTNGNVSPGLVGIFTDMGAPPPFGRSWFSADYLMWWFKDAPLPVPIVTTSNAADAGVIGRPSTQVLFGNQPLDAGMQSGIQLNLGHWIDNDEIIGIEASVFYFVQRNDNNFTGSTSNPNQVLAVPYTTPAGVPSAFIISGTNPNNGAAIVGSVSATSSTSLWGAEINGLLNLARTEYFQISLLGGFRSIFLEESLNMNYEAQLPPGSGFGPLYNATLADQFSTRNQFYGGQLGVKGEWTNGIFYGSVVGKVALGVNHETVNINGQFSDPNAVFYSTYGAGPGGLLAQRTNIGSYTGNNFCVVPELQLKLGVNLTKYLQLYVGYDFLFLSQVVRPGDQIDPVINPTQAGPNPSGGGTASPLIGAARPMPLFAESTFWAQGVNFGFQFTF
jgi:hypothetical protein